MRPYAYACTFVRAFVLLCVLSRAHVRVHLCIRDFVRLSCVRLFTCLYVGLRIMDVYLCDRSRAHKNV